MVTPLVSKPVERSFSPELCPYQIVFVDVTHRCNMACNNCYVPNRDIPDLDAEWLSSILARLPRGRMIRLVGAEPTVRNDLFRIIADVRRHGHHPAVLTNGLRLADREYTRALKKAGVSVVYLSLSGGFNDDAYEAIDGLRCAERKRRALENVCAENIHTGLGMILVRGVNEDEPRAVIDFARSNRQVRALHLRGIGRIGRYMESPGFTVGELLTLFARNADVDPSTIVAQEMSETAFDFRFGARLRVQLTEWPDLGSSKRGRLTPEGLVAPFFEHVLANQGGY